MRKLRISVVSFPLSDAFVTPLSNLTEILCCFSDDVHVITGSVKDVKVRLKPKEIQTYSVHLKETNNLLARIMRYIHLQIQISLLLAKLLKNVDLNIFFMEAGAFLPALTAKLLRKKILLVLPSSITQMAKYRNDFFDKILICLQSINYELADRIIIYSPNLINEWNLGKHKQKIMFAHEHFIDFNEFRPEKRFSRRKCLIGYVGRLSIEKGVLNFVNAIPIVLRKKDAPTFIIVGNGKLDNVIEEFLNKRQLNNAVSLIGWAPHERLPAYLNELQLLVLPSFTEGLPNVILETMACGTPVLATPVGAIPNIIKDGQTGFLLESNDPEYIANRIIELLSKPGLLEKVGKNASEWIRENSSKEETIRTWQRILNRININ